MKSDQELILEYKKGKFGAFEELYERYRNSVYFYALSLSRNRTLAEEVSQEAFIGFARNIKKLDKSVAVRSYLLRCVRNAVIDHKRRVERHAASSSPLENPDLFEYEDDSVEARELAAIARDALNELDDDQREVVILKVFESMTFREIAEFTGSGENTVTSRFRYAKEKLKRKLSRQMNE